MKHIAVCNDDGSKKDDIDRVFFYIGSKKTYRSERKKNERWNRAVEGEFVDGD